MMCKICKQPLSKQHYCRNELVNQKTHTRLHAFPEGIVAVTKQGEKIVVNNKHKFVKGTCKAKNIKQCINKLRGNTL